MKHAVWLLLLFQPVSGALAAAAPAPVVQTSGCLARFRAGVLAELKNRFTGEVLVGSGSQFGPGTGVRRSRDQMHVTAPPEPGTRLSDSGARVAVSWPDGVRLSQAANPDGDTIVIRQQAVAGAGPLAGVQWALGVVPPGVDVLVPGNSGLRFGAGAPDGDWSFDYPISWEAQFVVLQGKAGGCLIWAEDNASHFKALTLARRNGRTCLGFETRATAPFARVRRVQSVTWRIRCYRGSWLTGARLYREWAEKTFGLAAIRAKRPRWAEQIRCVVIVPMEMALLDELAKRLNPAQTLLYVPGWRRDGYDRNYPDYTPDPQFGPWLQRAHALGFRVMPHVNYFGCDPLHPLYQRFQAYQMRDPFTDERLWWLWDRVDPIIRFAYINPASRAWRQLFVSRMKELCTRYPIDALHLDQTLCIFNDNNGVIDGMNCMQGNIALHRELRAALPQVALSGEGLDEITYRYEEFCQRHLFGLNHADGEWNDGLIALAHPISSSLLTPHTTIYGYLGMANPSTGGLYQAWRRGYDHFGVIPTLAHTDARQVREDRDLLDPFFAEAAFFQRTQAVPDFTGPWPDEVIFRYRLAGGGKALLMRDRGVVLREFPSGGPSREIYRRVEGVSSVAIPGSISGWRAYDEKKIIGLDPAHSYTVRAEPRDLNAFHIAALPEGAVVRRAGLRGDLATIALEDRLATVARLWDFRGRAEGGVVLFNRTQRRYVGAFFSDPSGGTASSDSGGLFLHPPWRITRRDQTTGINLAQGIGISFVEYFLKLPDRPRIRFEAGVCLREGAAGKSDGVTFRASAWPAPEGTAAPARTGADPRAGSSVLRAQVHHDGSDEKPLALDLSSLRGRRIVLRLETHPGPRGEATFDWAVLKHPCVVAENPEAQRVVVHAPRPVLAALGPDGPLPLQQSEASRYVIQTPLPSTFQLLFTQPEQVTLPVDLLTAPRSVALVGADGVERPPSGFAQAGRAEASVGGVVKPSLSTHPPNNGRIVVDYMLRLPPVPAHLEAFAGIRDGSLSKGVGFAVLVNGGEVWSARLLPKDHWQPVRVDLARYAGQPVVVSLMADSLGSYEFDWAVWGEPRLVAQ